jgi:MarR family transcriptional regulator for hemolysin
MTSPIDLGIMLGLAYQGFVDQLHAHLASRGFTRIGPADGYVVRALAEAPLNQRELAERLGITEQGAGKIVGDMRRRKLVARQADPRDARVWRLHLAERGELLLREARGFHRQFEAELAGSLGRDAAAALRLALAWIVERAADDTSQGRLRIP